LASQPPIDRLLVDPLDVYGKILELFGRVGVNVEGDLPLIPRSMAKCRENRKPGLQDEVSTPEAQIQDIVHVKPVYGKPHTIDDY